MLHQSLTRPILLAGGERDLTMANLTLAMVMIVGMRSLFAAAAGVIICTGIQFLLRTWAKVDPQMFDVFRRSMRYQKMYPAQALESALPPEIKKSISI